MLNGRESPGCMTSLMAGRAFGPGYWGRTFARFGTQVSWSNLPTSQENSGLEGRSSYLLHAPRHSESRSRKDSWATRLSVCVVSESCLLCSSFRDSFG